MSRQLHRFVRLSADTPRRAAGLLALALIVFASQLLAAREVPLPLRFDNALVEKLLVAQLFHDLLLATAWKESCWRQYVREKGVVKTIESVTGALGMMQVAPDAWRGFYDVTDLSEDIGYNARAGAEILAHYLTRYAIRKREDTYGIPDALARATYAVYNGGPSHRRRYRLKNTRKSLRAIDRSFYQKYLSIKAGKTREVMTCYLG